MPFDLQRAQQDTPATANLIHFNNAGSSLMPQPVLEATIAHLQLEAQIGGYEAADRAHNAIEHTYDAAATLIGCQRDEIAIIENATRAWDMAFYSIPFKPGDRILTSIAEYASNYIAYLQIAQKTGASVEAIPNDPYGQLSIDALRKSIDERVKLIAITHVPTNGGLVNPVAEVGKVAREANILYLVDACQSVGQMPIDVNKIGCDFLSATGRKYLRGPRGTGFLYVRSSVIEQLEPPFLDLHAAHWIESDRYEIRSDARRFENWETNYAGKIGLGVAIDYALEWGLETTWRRIKNLAYLLRTRLSTLPGVIVHDRGITQCGIVTFTVEDKRPEEIQQQLAQQNINVTISERSSTLLDMDERKLTTLVRASVHYFNSEEEIEQFCTVLSRLI
ncbi:aminotransferase class V-fold PLP-dependent enzyme [Ktedonosporobacter rubrisoli]|uniref:Aminotransferase class V-fold PLP-dependent enzyme n=1 Tax=Ktedonosporobacter rubrisoli TaxID=2509675 RepID=A0A4P6K2Y3_KTERU|nr:aminotransferase class V-fold PLP-dependent enzyme [Ktedonosporobacter rubrisoli]QBD81846.1 aminotransferase class V-fold PLP-dependent enzyme [Ktedonosporobacter rubrisoli]